MKKLERLMKALRNFRAYPSYPAYSLRPDTYWAAWIYFYIGVALHPLEYRRRRRLLRSLPESTSKIAMDKGFIAFEPSRFPRTSELVSHCQNFFLQERENLERTIQKKKFLLQYWILPKETQHQVIWDFATNPEFVAIISKYLGYVPQLGSTLIWYSPNSELEEGRSQMYHLDGEDVSQIKVFVHLSDVDFSSGPLTLIPRKQSRAIFDDLYRKKHVLRRNTKIDDDTVYRLAQKSEEVVFTGPPGTIALVDTDRCYHFGSRPGNKPRLILQLQYIGPFSMHQPLTGRSMSEEIRSQYKNTRDFEIKNLVLGYQQLAHPKVQY